MRSIKTKNYEELRNVEEFYKVYSCFKTSHQDRNVRLGDLKIKLWFSLIDKDHGGIFIWTRAIVLDDYFDYFFHHQFPIETPAKKVLEQIQTHWVESILKR